MSNPLATCLWWGKIMNVWSTVDFFTIQVTMTKKGGINN